MIPAFAGTLVLGGCDKPSATPFAEGGKADTVDCALAGAADFTPSCAIERTASADGLTLTIRNPDGGFRRLKVTSDGRGVIAADGAAPAAVSIVGDKRVEVALGGDRYRLPATVKR